MYSKSGTQGDRKSNFTGGKEAGEVMGSTTGSGNGRQVKRKKNNLVIDVTSMCELIWGKPQNKWS